MKRIYILLLTAALCITTAMAVPARRSTFKVTQSDGSTLTLRLVGDEYHHYYLNVATGEAMVRGANGDFEVISESTLTERASKAQQRRSAANATRMKRLPGKSAVRRVGDVSTSITGSKKGIVILVNFSDKSLASGHTQSEFNDMFNKVGYNKNSHIGSVHDYFYDQSYKQFDLTFDVVGPVTVSQKLSYYGSNDSNGNDKYPATMVSEAIKLADAKGVNFKDYDWDGDGYVDQVFVIYAGYGEAAGAASNTIWPHEWELSSAASYDDGEGTITLDGVKIDTYACSCELAGTSGSTLNGIGTACHEFSHCLGYPDFYDTDYSGGIGMDAFDVMDMGSYGGPDFNGEVPCGYTAYERWMAGWLEPEVIDEAATITNMAALNDSPEAYIIFNEKHLDEYFLLENRQANRWFKYFADVEAGHGLFVTHVDYNSSAWTNNTPNDVKSHQRMTWVAADGKYGTYDSSNKYWSVTETEGKGDFFPGTKNITSMTGSSHQSVGGKFFNQNTDGSYGMNHALTEIKEADGKISFLVDGGKLVDDGSRYTVTLNAGTGSCSTTTFTQTSFMQTLTLPACTSPNDEWTFIGWSTKEIDESTTKPTQLYAQGSTYLPTADATLYAVYKQTVEGSGPGGEYVLDYDKETKLQSTTLGYGNPVKYTAIDGSQWVVKAYKNVGMQLNKGKDASIKVPDCPASITSIVVTDKTARTLAFSSSDYTGSTAPAAAATSNSATTATIDLSGKNLTTGYIYTTDGATVITKIVVNYGATATVTYATYPDAGTLATPTITFASDKQSILLGDTNDSFTATVTGSTGAVTYTSSDESVATIGPKTGRVVAKGVGTTTITATVAGVAGVSRSAQATYQLTVTMPELSSIAITQMPSQLTYMEGETFDQSGLVITATYANGYKTVVDHGYTLQPNTDDALKTTDTEVLVSYTEGGVTKTTTIAITVTEKPKYTVTFYAGTGTCTDASLSESEYQGGVTLPKAEGPSDEWVFCGWATTSVDETSTQPELLPAGTLYIPKADTSLYAVYSYSVSEGGSGNYELVTSSLEDWSGEYIIAYSATIMADGRTGGKKGIGLSQSHVSPGSALSGTTIASEWGDLYHVTLKKNNTGYALLTQDGQCNYQTKNENGLVCSSDLTNAGMYPITIKFISSSDIDILCKGTAFHYNKAIGTTGEMFRFYKDGSQNNIYLYKKQGTLVSVTYNSNPSTATIGGLADTVEKANAGSATLDDVNKCADKILRR